MKVNFFIDKKTKVEFEKDIEPEIIITTSEGLLVEVFGTEEDLTAFANEIHQKVSTQSDRGKQHDLKQGSYYVVEVEFFKGNFRHMAIFYFDGMRRESNYGTLFSSSYEHPHNVKIENLHYFHVISEITDMKNGISKK